VATEGPEVTDDSTQRAAEVHGQVRKHARKFVRPGVKSLEIAEEIEMSAGAPVGENGLESGIGFPAGLNIDDCAAQYNPSLGDATGKS